MSIIVFIFLSYFSLLSLFINVSIVTFVLFWHFTSLCIFSYIYFNIFIFLKTIIYLIVTYSLSLLFSVLMYFLFVYLLLAFCTIRSYFSIIMIVSNIQSSRTKMFLHNTLHNILFRNCFIQFYILCISFSHDTQLLTFLFAW